MQARTLLARGQRTEVAAAGRLRATVCLSVVMLVAVCTAGLAEPASGAAAAAGATAAAATATSPTAPVLSSGP